MVVLHAPIPMRCTRRTRRWESSRSAWLACWAWRRAGRSSVATELASCATNSAWRITMWTPTLFCSSGPRIAARAGSNRAARAEAHHANQALSRICAAGGCALSAPKAACRLHLSGLRTARLWTSSGAIFTLGGVEHHSHARGYGWWAALYLPSA